MYDLITLPNGLRIVSEKLDTVRSAALGIWVGVGSRYESLSEGGSAHFIEHMLFKGTSRRSASDIARETDAIGGQINAFTTKECTCFYARVLDNHLEQVLDILYDMVYCSRFDQKDVDTERGVILEEIGMYQDTPDDLCSERLFAAVYPHSSLGRPILGKASNLKKFTGEALRAWQEKHYTPANTVVSLSGSFSDEFLQTIVEKFSLCPQKKAPNYRPTSPSQAITLKKKAIEQNHLSLAFPGLSYLSPDRFTLQLLSSILGGGMSSRLFQEVREKQGLCYSVYCYGAGHDETGTFHIYTALGRETEMAALKTILEVVKTFVAEGCTQEELERAREQSKANVLMGMESTQARMSHMGRSLLFAGEILSAEDIIAAYDKVTCADIQHLALQIFDWEAMSLSAVGRVASREDYEAILFPSK